MTEEDRQIPGHKLYYPLTMQNLQHARIILIAKADMNIHVMKEHMDCETATIRIKVGNTKISAITVGGIYREHTQLGSDDSNDTTSEKLRKQRWRWN